MNLFRCAPFLVLTMGCSTVIDGHHPSVTTPYADPYIPYVEGDRLVAHTLGYAGMQPLLLSPYDRKTALDCTYQSVGNEIHCLSKASSDPGVEATEGPALAASPVDMVLDKGSDGSVFPAMLSYSIKTFDHHWQLSCEPQFPGVEAGATSSGKCLPPYADNEGFFKDDSCEKGLFEGRLAPTEAPVVASTVEGYFRVGKPYSGDVYTGGPQACQSFPQTTPAFQFYEPGEKLDDSEISPVDLAYVGSDRLKIATLLRDGQTLATGYVGSAPEAVFFDSTRASSCQAVRTPSDGVRCFTGTLISDPSQNNQFADPQCSQLAIARTNDADVAVTPLDLATPAAPTLAVVTALWHLDLASPLNMVYQMSQGQCVAVPSKQDLFPLIPSDDWSQFAAFEERIGDTVVP